MTATLAAAGSVIRWIFVPLAAYALASRFAGRSIPASLRRWLLAGALVVIAWSLLAMVTATHYLQYWDYVCFWLYGHAVSARANVYAPSTYHALVLPMPVGACVAAIVGLAALTVAAIPLLGPGGLQAYLASNPVSRMPVSVFSETPTASLSSIVLRLHPSRSPATLVFDPLYVVPALAIVALGVWAIARASERDDDLTLGVTLAAGLVLYPGTLDSYAIVLVPALLATIRVTAHRRVAVACASTAFFAANALGGVPTFVGVAALGFLGCLALVSGAPRKRRDSPHTPLPLRLLQ